MSSTPSHFLDLNALDTRTVRAILDTAVSLKRARKVPKALAVPDGAVLAMIFEKPSTRTRVSFEMAMHQLGGAAIVLNAQDMQLGRGETIADTARVLSRYVNAIMLRTGPHEGLLEFAEYADIPVINALTARSHPCQIMADVLTFEEHKGPIKGRVVAWLGDANNVATSWVHLPAARFGFTLRMASPADFGPDPELLKAMSSVLLKAQASRSWATRRLPRQTPIVSSPIPGSPWATRRWKRGEPRSLRSAWTRR